MSHLKRSVLVLALALACPHELVAQEREGGLKLPTTMFVAAAAADWATTYHGLKHYRLREMNPVLRPFDDTPAKMVLIGGAIDVGAVAAWHYAVGRNHPRIAAAGLWTMTAFRAYLAFHNIRNQQKAGRR
ncbi:MAG: DUF5658 family protein [Vicinamibacterales bacterium]